MLYLDKLLTQLAYPLGFSMGLAVLAVVLLAVGSHRFALVALSIGILWLGLWSIPVASDRLRMSLEGQFVPQSVGTLPTAEAVVVLGGGINGAPGDWPYPDLGRASDRVWHAARIYHAGKAPRVILSGGSLPWLGERPAEADAMGAYLRDLGVPTEAILREGRSRNTRENALYTAEILKAEGIDKILLVTSALHMPRALGAFRAVGVEANPAPTDFEVMPEPGHPIRWLPDAEALSDSTRALKEYLGLWVYRWRGWAES
jgi:uncharacterized SAM-binding protein YcdF (DUF218 family)